MTLFPVNIVIRYLQYHLRLYTELNFLEYEKLNFLIYN